MSKGSDTGSETNSPYTCTTYFTNCQSIEKYILDKDQN